jgi:hypothetical protein
MTIAEERDAEKVHAITLLRRWIPLHSTVSTMFIAGRGERDYIRAFIAREGRVVEITANLAHAIGRTLTKRGIAMNGSGYDKGYEVVDDLAAALYPDETRERRARKTPSHLSILNHDRL